MHWAAATGEYHDDAARVCAPQLSCGFDTVEGGHLEIHHCDVRTMAPSLLDRGTAVGRMRDDLDVLFQVEQM
jgi:hypothetical protein